MSNVRNSPWLTWIQRGYCSDSGLVDSPLDVDADYELELRIITHGSHDLYCFRHHSRTPHFQTGTLQHNSELISCFWRCPFLTFMPRSSRLFSLFFRHKPLSASYLIVYPSVFVENFHTPSSSYLHQPCHVSVSIAYYLPFILRVSSVGLASKSSTPYLPKSPILVIFGSAQSGHYTSKSIPTTPISVCLFWFCCHENSPNWWFAHIMKLLTETRFATIRHGIEPRDAYVMGVHESIKQRKVL